MRRPILNRPPLVPALLLGLSFFMVAGLTFLACGGAKQRPTEEYWSEEQAEESRPLRETEELTKSAAPELDASINSTEALLGVRHDLMIAPATKHVARCSCLAVETGDPHDPRFQWQSGSPDVGPGATAIALSGRGVDCPSGPSDEAMRRPSISAVDVDGADVVVEVEEIPEGRPIASGAIIPKPAAGGSIYVRSKNPKLPYAKPAPGQRFCKVL